MKDFKANYKVIGMFDLHGRPIKFKESNKFFVMTKSVGNKEHLVKDDGEIIAFSCGVSFWNNQTIWQSTKSQNTFLIEPVGIH